MNLLEGFQCFTASLGTWHQRIATQGYTTKKSTQILHCLTTFRYNGTAAEYWHCSLHSGHGAQKAKYGTIYSTISAVAGFESLSLLPILCLPYNAMDFSH